MKYSIVMPYLNRAPQLRETLLSFTKFYRERNDYEVVLIEDDKQTTEMTLSLFELLDEFRSRITIVHKRSEAKNAHNPATAYNEGAFLSTGKYIILTSPECRHEVNLLSEFDKELELEPDGYIVCACKALKQNGKMHMWYQHSVERNLKYHFCTVINRRNYIKIGGFDERYTPGWGYDDNSFIFKVTQSGVPISVRDDLLVSHQWHEKTQPSNYRLLLKRNRNLFEKEVLGA